MTELGNKLRPVGDKLIGFAVHCLECGKLYIPSHMSNECSRLNVPIICVNNFCSLKCKWASSSKVFKDKVSV